MAILVVGSVAFDGIESPSGRVERVLGGAATHFSLAASYFTQVRVIGVVGEDFTAQNEAVFTRRGIDTRGIEHTAGKSFFWAGSYLDNLNEARTLKTELNVFQSFSPKIPAEYADSEFLFLANIDPVLQAEVRVKMPNVKLVCGDTMNYWINDHTDNLKQVLKGLDGLLINDTEAKLLAQDSNLVKAADKILAMGPKSLVVKHGEYGATAFFSEKSFPEAAHAKNGRTFLPFRAPALPLAEVVDPTGAGDSFAGGFFGYIAAQKELTPAVFKTAMFYGGVMGSFAVERFGTERLQQLDPKEIEERFALFRGSRTLNKSFRRSIDPATLSEAERQHLQLRSETFVVAWSALLLSLLALSYCYSHNLLLLYGDAVAHLHIARRMVDSLHPGFRQMGSVWLPLPHILLMPFVARLGWWQNGLAGAFPSMAAYVFGAAGIYRLARMWLAPLPSLVAPFFFALNPGLVYTQTTAMNEPLLLAEMIWTALLLVEYRRAIDANDLQRAARLLMVTGLVLVGAVYTRYDGWIFAAIAWVVALLPMRTKARWQSKLGGAFVLFTAMLAVAPLLWFGYCARQFGDWLDFMRGPYSAKMIDIRTTKPGAAHYPGWHSMPVAALHFLKAAELGATILRCANLLLWLSIAGTVAAVTKYKGVLPALLLWMPLPFYAYSVAYGSVPIFIPLWWPHSYYNTRYGMEMLAVFALFLAFFVAWVADRIKQRWPQAANYMVVAMLLLLVANSAVLFHATPLVMREAIANSRTRIPFEAAYARALEVLPPNSILLAYISEHPGAYETAGIELKHTINESDWYEWVPALRAPAKSADFVISTDGDAVEKAVAAYPEGLTLIDIVCSTGQPCVHVYRSDRHTASGSITQK